MTTPDVAIVGAGIIGLATAWRLSQAGLSVHVHDPAPGSGASTVAAGMLAPVGETHYETTALLPLLLASAAAWPDFAADLEAASGREVGYRADGTLTVACDADGVRQFEHQAAFHGSLGLAAQRVPGSVARDLEPLLTPRVRGGLRVDGDHQVDPRRVVAALRDLVPVHRDQIGPGRLDAGTVLLAAGWRTRALAGLPVRPVKGQLLRLRATPDTPRLRRVIRGSVRNQPVYLVPRDDGEVVVGATSEERGADTTVTAGAVHDLLRPALELVPVLAEYQVAETCAGLRPGTPDNLPVVGRLDAHTVVAAGHYRNGVLLAPVTAETVTELITTGRTPDLLAPLDPRRFG